MLLGKAWSEGYSAFPDWNSPKTQNWWRGGLNDLYDLTLFDGIWLDMNEATMINCDGECYPETQNLSPQSPRSLRFLEATPLGNETGPNDNYYDLPFKPTGSVESLYKNSISLNASHYASNAEDEPLNIEYNMHNLYGTMQSKATHEFMTTQPFIRSDRRPFVVSHSTFAGAGRWASHSLGHNHATWNDMKSSIPGVMSMNVSPFC